MELGRALRHPAKRSAGRAEALGEEVIARGFETLDLAYIHGEALLALMPDLPDAARETALKRSGAFFIAALRPIERTREAMIENAAELKRSNSSLRQRTTDLTAANRHLTAEIEQRTVAERLLKAGEKNYRLLLVDSHQMQRRLKHLSHQVLLAQESERKEISRELHDEIVQTLTGINVQLASLKLEAGATKKSFSKHIGCTQRLVRRSVDIVHRFARDLRPTLLDDLGLIPALHAYMKDFTKRTGLKVGFSTFAGVEQLSNDKRTILYRVAQAALVNVAQHAKAAKVSVVIKSLPEAVTMVIKDDGKAFDTARVLDSRANKRLGLIGMRERLEMVGGVFAVHSAKGLGTTISASVPFKRRVAFKTHEAN
jgi:signal transduction histidine kinase